MVCATFAAVMVHVQHVDSARRDQRERAPRRNGPDDGGLYIRLVSRSTSTGLIDTATAQITGPQIVKPAILDQYGNRAVILVGHSHCASANNISVTRHKCELGS